MVKVERKIIAVFMSVVCIVCMGIGYVRADDAYDTAEVVENKVFYFNPFELENFQEGYSVFSARNTVVYDGNYRSELNDRQKEIYDALVDKYIQEDGFFPSEDTDGLTGLKLSVAETFNAKLERDTNGNLNLVENDAYNTAVYNISNDCAYAFFAFAYDYPEAYWMGGIRYSFSISVNYKQGKYIGEINNLNMEIDEKYDGATSQVKDYVDGINLTISELDSVKCNSVEERVKSIHDYLCDLLNYNYAAAQDTTGEYEYSHSNGTVFTRTNNCSVVCQAYGEAFKVLCDYYSIPCVQVVGKANGAHLWNYVRIDNAWYAVDVTWDDQPEEITYTYYLVGSTTQVLNGVTFSDNHVALNDTFDSEGIIMLYYPVLSDISYAEYLKNQTVIPEETTSLQETETQTLAESQMTTESKVTENIDGETETQKEEVFTGETETSTIAESSTKVENTGESEIQTEKPISTESQWEKESQTATGIQADTESYTVVNDRFETESNTISENQIETADETSITDNQYETSEEEVTTVNQDKNETSSLNAASNLKRADIIKTKNISGRKVKIIWKKIKGSDGYQIKYKSGKKHKLTKVKGSKKTSLIWRGLRRNKVYKFYVRCYKIVSGKCYYGPWSKGKKIRIRK